ncbi:hypothetical protein FRB95_001871 [Tulasnella sp. JGI-2019a]|nr:hypothetical protein FRB95_001871 [Tulasnella sp. JGI-2019a]
MLVDQPPKSEESNAIIKRDLMKPDQILQTNAPTVTNSFDLPVEILIQILILASHVQDPDQLAQYVARKTIFPFTALDVCQRWRTIAHDTPSIWTRATIIPDPTWYPRLMEHSTNCGSLPVHLDVMISQKQDIYMFEELLAKLLDVNYDTHVRSVRVIGAPEDGSFHISTVNTIGRYFSVGNRIGHLELALRNGSSSWGEISLACLTPLVPSTTLGYADGCLLHQFTLMFGRTVSQGMRRSYTVTPVAMGDAHASNTRDRLYQPSY